MIDNITCLPYAKVYMEIQKIFSSMEDDERLYSVLLTEEELALFSELSQREFGFKSKALAVMAPGSYQAKEAAKYGYEGDEYKNVRGKYALKGLFAPGTATYVKKGAERMAKEGKSKKEIREYLENEGKNRSKGRVAAGVVEAVTGSFGGAGTAVAQGVGLYDKFTGNRAGKKSDKKKKN